MKISFRDFLLCEDLATDVLKTQHEIAELESRKARTSKPLDDQITRLKKVLLMKQQQMSRERQNQNTATTPPTQQPTTTNEPQS